MRALLITLSMILIACPVFAADTPTPTPTETDVPNVSDDTPTPWPTETPTPTNSPTRTATPTATGTIPTATVTSCPALTFDTTDPIYYPGIPFDEQMIRHIDRLNQNERNMTECSSDPVDHWMNGVVVEIQTTPPAAPPPGFTRFFPQGTGFFQRTSDGTITAIIENSNTRTPTPTATNTSAPLSTNTPTVTPTPNPNLKGSAVTLSYLGTTNKDAFLWIGDVPCTATAGIVMPRAGSVISLGAQYEIAVAGPAGSIVDIHCLVNGTSVFRCSGITTSTGVVADYDVQAPGVDTFAAGDVIGGNFDLQGSSNATIGNVIFFIHVVFD